MNNRKYQIFVSSTFKDLESERIAVIDGILRTRNFPVGMELFSASPDEQFEYIKKIIDNCDYYILIIGGCYGTVNQKTNKSYTEMEFEYALSKKIPVLVFPYKDIQQLQKKDADLTNIKRFTEYAMKDRMCRLWTSPENLKYEVGMSLPELFETYPRQGWQRFEDKSSLLEEINTIRKEKEELVKENSELNKKLKQNNPKFSNIVRMDEEISIKFTSNNYHKSSIQNNELNISLDELFLHVAYDLRCMKLESDFQNLLMNFIQLQISNSYNIVKKIEKESYESIVFTLEAYKLVKITTMLDTYIQLTEDGEQYLASKKIFKTANPVKTS